MTRARSAIFWVLMAALVICHAVVAWHSLFVMRFWEDEAFNLTVPLNLIQGLGYASDGALSGSTITPFDPRISTGPAVLLPVAGALATGSDLVFAARIVPLLYWVGLLVGLYVLGQRIGGRWAGLMAAAVPLVFNAGIGESPIQGPADLLGEIPAAALIVWALVLLPRRAWLAGLFVGLAIQAKLIALLALPAFAVAMFVLDRGRGWSRLWGTLRRGWVPLVMVGVPTALVEVFALVSLGPAAFADHLRGLRDFVLSGGQAGERTSVLQKLQTLTESWFVWPWAVVLAAFVAVALVVAGLIVSRRPPASERLAVLLAAAVGLMVFVGWWATASHLPLWVRHPAPGIFAFVPVLAAGAAWGAGVLWSRRAAPRVLAGVGGGVLVVAVAVGAGIHVADQFAPRDVTLMSQREAVEPIRVWVAENEIEWLAADPWGAAVAPVVIAGAHLGESYADAMAEVPRLTTARCTTETIIDVGYYRVCTPPEG